MRYHCWLKIQIKLKKNPFQGHSLEEPDQLLRAMVQTTIDLSQLVFSLFSLFYFSMFFLVFYMRRYLLYPTPSLIQILHMYVLHLMQ